MDTVRVCTFKNPVFFTVKKFVGDPTREQLFSGPAAPAVNEFIAFCGGGHPNVTIVEKESTIDCLVAMNKNESETVLNVLAYGSQDFDAVFPHNVFREVKMTIFSVYNATSPDSVHYVDIPKSAVEAVSAGVMVATLFVILSSYLLLNVGYRINYKVRHLRCIHRKQKHRLQFLFEIFGCFLQKQFTEFKDTPRRASILVLMLTSFFVLSGLACVLATQLVVLDYPKVIETYDDIMKDPQIKTFFPPYVRESMETSGPQSRNGKFAIAAKHRLFHSKKEGLDLIMEIARDLFHRSLVLMFPNVADRQVRELICMLYPITGSFMIDRSAFPYHSQDPQGESINMVFVMSQFYRTTKEGQKVISGFRRMVEGGIPGQTINTLEYSDKKADELLEKGNYYKKCRTSLIVKPEVPHSRVELRNLKSLVSASTFSGILIINVLIIEVFVRRMCRKRRRNERQTNL